MSLNWQLKRPCRSDGVISIRCRHLVVHSEGIDNISSLLRSSCVTHPSLEPLTLSLVWTLVSFELKPLHGLNKQKIVKSSISTWFFQEVLIYMRNCGALKPNGYQESVNFVRSWLILCYYLLGYCLNRQQQPSPWGAAKQRTRSSEGSY